LVASTDTPLATAGIRVASELLKATSSGENSKRQNTFVF
jgi:hypothetical protein